MLGGVAVVVTATVAASCALSGCSLVGGTAKTAATGTFAADSPTASPSSGAPSAGWNEPASALPKTCDKILSTAQLQAVFGAGLPIGENYGAYAALPSIGRTGRVTCVFGVGLDSFGRQSAGVLEVSISTYTTAANAAGRAADTVQSDTQAGATTAQVSVGGRPAAIVVEQTPVGASSAAASGAASSSAASSNPVSSAGATPTASASPAASGAAAGGETELVMADGNRTFVLQIPFARLPAQQAVTALTSLALEVYRNTLPNVAGNGASASSTG